jgi:peptide-methionine (S)-S-oxide reductase
MTCLAGGSLMLVVLAGIKAMSSGEEGRADGVIEPSAPSGVGSSETLEKATFGAGCFWCVEAVFQGLKGVEHVASGYSGGQVVNPTYRQVCSGVTGHAEVVQIRYDPSKISYAELLEIFWGTHDPTTRNRQGNDVGPQYRSVIFAHNDAQQKLAEHYREKLNASEAFSGTIVTEIVPFRAFFRAEDYHQNYFKLNEGMPYCQIVIQPKMEKLNMVFRDKLKQRGHDPIGSTRQ